MKLLKPFAALGFAFLAAFGAAQSNVPPTLKLQFPSSAKHGVKVEGTLVVTFGPGLHAYQNPASDPDLIPVAVTVTTKGVTLKPVKYPAGKNMSVGGDPKPVKVYGGSISIPLSVVVPKKGKINLAVNFHYQQCNPNSCYPPSDETASATITVK